MSTITVSINGIYLSSQYIVITVNIVANCVWGPWSEGKCSVTCGTGKRLCTRTKRVKEKCGGKKCNGSSTMYASCKKKCCPGKFYCNSVIT